MKFERTQVWGFEHAFRGMRNPKNSWHLSDSNFSDDCHSDDPNQHCEHCSYFDGFGKPCIPYIGPKDLKLAQTLIKGGSEHRKFLRQIFVSVDITAPLYWWKEFDTYKVGTVANSCSTMHKIHEKEFTLEDFSCEHLERLPRHFINNYEANYNYDAYLESTDLLDRIIGTLNIARDMYLETKDKRYWWQMIQLLPSSYNQKRTVMLNYEVLAGIYTWRKNHKLDEWREFCKWIEDLPYSEIITGETGMGGRDGKEDGSC